jgi:ribosomal protein S19E (S16A)
MEQPDHNLSPSEKRTLQQVAQRELEAGVGWDWVALQRLKRLGLIEERGDRPRITAEGRRVLQKLVSSA